MQPLPRIPCKWTHIAKVPEKAMWLATCRVSVKCRGDYRARGHAWNMLQEWRGSLASTTMAFNYHGEVLSHADSTVRTHMFQTVSCFCRGLSNLQTLCLTLFSRSQPCVLTSLSQPCILYYLSDLLQPRLPGRRERDRR